MSEKTRRSARAGAGKAVAPTAAVEAPAADPAPTTASEPEVPQPVKTCRNCGRRAVYETDGISAAPVAYCRADLPANISRDMVQRYQATQK